MTAGTHEAFIGPTNDQSPVWRYMDFTKFVAMLEAKALYFARADRLGDSFEGSYSRANMIGRPEVYKDKIPEEGLREIARIFSWMPKWTFISSWHLNERESAAMWKLYTRTDESIAIESTFAALRDCLPNNVFLGLVKDIDYETEWVPEGNFFYPFLHKRKSFEHEREVRAIWQELTGKDGRITVDAPLSNLGQEVPV